MAGGGFDTPVIGQSLTYTSLQKVVVESVSVTEAHTFSSPGPVQWEINISVSTKYNTPTWTQIFANNNYGSTYSNVYTSTAADVAAMQADLRFQAFVFAQGGSDRVVYLNDVNMLAKFASISDGNVRLAQSFTTPAGGYGIGGVDLLLKQIGTITDVIVEIQTDSSDAPSGTVVSGTSVTVPAANIPSTLGWVTANFTGAPTLAATTKYWIVVRSASAFGSNNFLLWRAKIGNTYSNGKMSYYSGGSWTGQSTVDNLFRVKKGTGGVFSVDIDSRYKARWQ